MARRPEDLAGHWDTVYATREVSQVSWFQAIPATSLVMLGAAGVTPALLVIDVGAGASPSPVS